jgi:hypothetical protein
MDFTVGTSLIRKNGGWGGGGWGVGPAGSQEFLPGRTENHVKNVLMKPLGRYPLPPPWNHHNQHPPSPTDAYPVF